MFSVHFPSSPAYIHSQKLLRTRSLSIITQITLHFLCVYKHDQFHCFLLASCPLVFPFSSLLAIIFSMPGRRNGTGKQVASAQSQPPANRSITSATPTLKPLTRTLRPCPPPVNPTQAQPGSSTQGKHPFSGGDSNAVCKLIKKNPKKVHCILYC